jgi:hypothetical protein
MFAEDENKVVAYHYFTFTDKRSQIYDTLLKSLVLQLALLRSASRQVLVDAYDEADSGGRALDYDEVKEHLKSLLKLFDSSYIVLDALNECSERGEVFDFLEELHGWNVPGTRVLMSLWTTCQERRFVPDPLNRDGGTIIHASLYLLQIPF